jgi:Zn-finger nucleic acid-binding protein
MKCPNCGNRMIDIDFDYAGMTDAPIKECPLCNTTWTIKNGKVKILKESNVKPN